MRLTVLLLSLLSLPAWASSLESQFSNPPMEARPRVFWVWLHTALDKNRMTFELEEMKKKGIGGFTQWDPGAGPGRYGTRGYPLPAGPAWMSPEWCEAARHSFREADRLGLEGTLALTPGANCGGPWVTPEQSAQRLVWSSIYVQGPRHFSEQLPFPDAVAKGADGKPIYYRDIAVFAGEPSRVGHTRFTPEVSQFYPVLDQTNIPLGNPWTNVTKHMDANGRLTWDIPAGSFRILRFGHASTGQSADYFSTGQKGFYADHMDAAAVESNFRTMLDRLFGTQPLPRSLKYVHCDSYEVYNSDWTPKLLQEFAKRRGYDPAPFLPVLEGGNIESRNITARFREDLEKTRSECFDENHYHLLADLAHRRGIGVQAESGGPRVFAIDSLQMLGRNDVPMGEFWMEADTHRVTEDERYYVKEVACAAHIYGKRWVAAEAFTSLARHWEEDPWSLKPVGDYAFLEGVNRFVLHTFSNSPGAAGKPGNVYFAGSHFNPNITWWDQSRAWTDYLSRCQLLLSQGLFVADVLYYYGDQVPNFLPRKHLNPDLGPGFDYDVTNAEVLLQRASVRDGRIVLPDGMSYRVLVLPDRKQMPLEVLRKLEAMVSAGATVVGAPPSEIPGLKGFPALNGQVKALAGKLWGACDGKTVTENRYGKGRVVWGQKLRDVLASAGVGPDFAFGHAPADANLDAIHRRTADEEIYFVVNKKDRWEEVEASFRVRGMLPELWDPATGVHQPQATFRGEGEQTIVPLRLAPRGSVFVVFRKTSGKAPGADPVVAVEAAGAPLFPAPAHTAAATTPAEVVQDATGQVQLRAWRAGGYRLRTGSGKTATIDVAAVPAEQRIEGPWTVRFAPNWGAPESAEFRNLVSWTERPEAGIRFFSGAATYEIKFDVPAALVAANAYTVLDLGRVANLAEVRLNGRDLGVLWKVPFQVPVAGFLKAGENRLEVKVVNLWGNRMTGDESLPAGRQFTHTNMRKVTATTPLQTSGLLGPVRILAAHDIPVRWTKP
jgi:hypothetical protein